MVKAKRTANVTAKPKTSLVKIKFAPMLDLLSAVRDHGKLGELRATLQGQDVKLKLSSDDVTALKAFISKDPNMLEHPVGRSFVNASVGSDGDLGFPSGN